MRKAADFENEVSVFFWESSRSPHGMLGNAGRFFREARQPTQLTKQNAEQCR
jgi:hypothetical protein